MTQSQQKQFIKEGLKTLMKKYDVLAEDLEVALSEMKKAVLPEDFEEYYDLITEKQFRKKFPDYADDILRADECNGYNLTFLSWIYAKKKYRERLEEEELELLQLIEEDGEVGVVQVHEGRFGCRVYPVELEEIKEAVGTNDKENG